ncbi:MAG: flagellar biosynthesis anti-sigma factor FlgM [Candidatus Delongbacteria bacterium]|nr:flagellar biosynthesis anti-sigma factor FlgM [Candidatus Delongbacteria bacterium]
MNIQKTDATTAARELQSRELQKIRIEEQFQQRRSDPVVAYDRLQVSERGRQLQELSETLQQRLQELPEVREDRVAAARMRVQSGFYNEGTFNLKLAGKMLENSDLKQAVNLPGEEVPETDYRNKLMHDVKSKLESGFYTADAVMDFVADRLLQVYAADDEGGETVTAS